MMFSIIIPTYNGSAHIRDTINSVIQQSFKNFEIIVIDDASTDGTFELLSLYDGDCRVRLYKNETNLGLSKTVNYGVSLANGDIVLCLGHDDLLCENHLQTMSNVFSDKKVVLAHCAARIMDGKGNIGDYFISPLLLEENTDNIYYEMLKRNVFQSCGLCFRTDVFRIVGGWDENYKIFGEWLVYAKIARLGNVRFVTGIESYYRRHTSNVTNSFMTFKSYFERRKYNKKCRNSLMASANELTHFQILCLRFYHVLYDFRGVLRVVFN